MLRCVMVNLCSSFKNKIRIDLNTITIYSLDEEENTCI